MAENEVRRIAVLIDADNTSLGCLEEVLTELSLRGRIIVKRAYGNWKKEELKNWPEEINKLAIRAMQQFDYVAGKNATDIALVIDALDLLYTGNYDAFALVSSDSDYTPLAIRLHESGAYVYGFGKSNTSKSFVNACDEFMILENLLRTSHRNRSARVNRPGRPERTQSPSASVSANAGKGPAEGASAAPAKAPAENASGAQTAPWRVRAETVRRALRRIRRKPGGTATAPRTRGSRRPGRLSAGRNDIRRRLRIRALPPRRSARRRPRRILRRSTVFFGRSGRKTRTRRASSIILWPGSCSGGSSRILIREPMGRNG